MIAVMQIFRSYIFEPKVFNSNQTYQILMTRISNEIHGNSFSALVDIFELYKFREPVAEEVNSMLVLMGNQGFLYDNKVTGNFNIQSESIEPLSRILSSN